MHRHISFIQVAILSLVILAISDVASTAEPLTIGVIGDQTGTADIDASYGYLQKGVDLLVQKKAQIILHMGDLVESTKSNDTIRANFDKATSILNNSKLSWYLTAGDHDVNPVKYEPNSKDETKKKFFQALYAKLNKLVENKLYYSFNVGEYHFISLFSCDNLHTDPRWGDIYLAKINDEQLSWLSFDLSNYKESKGIIVFLHQPLWYNWSQWLPVHNILKKYPVSAVIAGHFHYPQDDMLLDGIHYIVNGACGGSLKQGNEISGGVYTVSTIEINGGNISGKQYTVTDGHEIAYQQRQDMDRVQSMDYMLDNIYMEPLANGAKYIKGKAIVVDCRSLDKTFNLYYLGNPINSALTISMKVLTPKITLSQPSSSIFTCISDTTRSDCTTDNYARIMQSNNSSVRFNYDCKLPPPAWSTGFLLQGKPQDYSRLEMKISSSFVSNGQKFELFRTILPDLKRCDQ